MEVTLAIYVRYGSIPFARIAIAFDNARKIGDMVSESDLTIGLSTEDVYKFVGFKKVNLANVI